MALMRTENLTIRLTREELDAFHNAAIPFGMSISAWARSKLIRAARADAAPEKEEREAAQ